LSPSTELTLADALDVMTGFEILAIQKQFGAALERISGTEALLGAVWAFENRREKTAWSKVLGMSMKELNGYFSEPEPDPEGEQGKDEA
jgi:hypothetical protein